MAQQFKFSFTHAISDLAFSLPMPLVVKQFFNQLLYFGELLNIGYQFSVSVNCIRVTNHLVLSRSMAC